MPSLLPRLLAGAGLLASTLGAADSTLMHCFAFTPVTGVSDADLQAFYAATDALPAKMPGVVTHVWRGKLMRPLAQYQPDADTGKQFREGATKAKGEISRVTRQYGVCMEMPNEAAYQKYASDPAHKEWDAAYAKVRVPGTTTFDVINAGSTAEKLAEK